MPDYTDFFEQALAENGLDARVVTNDSDPTRHGDFLIMKQVGDERLSYKTSINTTINVTDDQIRTEIAQTARHVAQMFEDKLTDTYEWAEGKFATLCVHEDGWAECRTCDTEVEVPDPPVALFASEAEMTTPQPMPLDGGRDLTALSAGQRTILRLYLLGRLRERCEPWCHNSKFNDFNRADMNAARPIE